MRVEDWSFSRGPRNELLVGGASAVDLARRYGTPLHVTDEGLLRARARSFRAAFGAHYPEVELFYALKCNAVAEIARTVFAEGLGAEVMSGYELWLARRLGVPAHRIVLNGPNKDDRSLRQAATGALGAVVVDSLSELARLEALADERRSEVPVLLRVNPDFVPRGMNAGSATGSRRGSVFGLDLKGGELPHAFQALRGSRWLRYLGLHAHIGSGIQHGEDYERAFRQIAPAFLDADAAGLRTRVFDFGGGFGVATSRELATLEFLAYQGWAACRGPVRRLSGSPRTCASRSRRSSPGSASPCPRSTWSRAERSWVRSRCSSSRSER
jgi:diaminopimelate decarboxylase